MKKISHQEQEILIALLRSRFITHAKKFNHLNWSDIESKLLENQKKLWSLYEMERTGGEPNLLEYDRETHNLTFCDFVKESPKERRSLCYDREAWEFRKKFKPNDNAKDVAVKMGVELMDENEYRKLQNITSVDAKTSSWLSTPERIRKLGGAIFGDFRYGQVFIYHNGADSYYASRGFRGVVRV